MLRFASLLMCACLSLAACKRDQPPAASAPQRQRIAYTHGNEVVVRDGVANGPELLRRADVTDPCLSPDGRTLVVTRGGAAGVRTLLGIDLDNRTEWALSVPGVSQVYGCVFSPDGQRLAFNELRDGQWQVGASRRDGSSPVTLTRSLPQKSGWFLAGLNHQTGRVLAQDMNQLAEVDWDGKGVSQQRIADLVNGFEISSACRFFIDRRGQFMIIDVEADEYLPGLEGPTGALLRVEVATHKVTRLSPTRLSVGQPWLDASGEAIYFTGCAASRLGQEHRGADCAGYRQLIGDHPPELWVKGGSSLSTSDL